jgi:hypothetical protein
LKLYEVGLCNGINEVIGITEGKWLNTAPLGIIVDDEDSDTAKLRLYKSHTRENIEKGSILWVNVNFDPLIFVISAFEDLSREFFESLNPPILKDTISWAKFDAELRGNFAELHMLEGEVIRSNIRAVNRGFNSLIEALVHATRYRISTRRELKEKIFYYGELVSKCGGKREKEAYRLLLEYTGLSSDL